MPHAMFQPTHYAEHVGIKGLLLSWYKVTEYSLFCVSVLILTLSLVLNTYYKANLFLDLLLTHKKSHWVRPDKFSLDLHDCVINFSGYSIYQSELN